MSQDTPFSDEPLPGMEPQAKLPEASELAPVPAPVSEDQQLHDPNLQPAGSYGRSDPASLAALPSLELKDPALHAAEHAELPKSSLTAFAESTAPKPAPNAAPEVGPSVTDFSNWDPHLAQLAQVGLVAADQWEEQIKPRIDQLHEDIDQINEQLDDLENAQRKTKKS
jgi:hypothetical protein